MYFIFSLAGAARVGLNDARLCRISRVGVGFIWVKSAWADFLPIDACDFGAKVCEFGINLCEFSVGACDFGLKVCELAAKSCDFYPNPCEFLAKLGEQIFLNQMGLESVCRFLLLDVFWLGDCASWGG